MHPPDNEPALTCGDCAVRRLCSRCNDPGYDTDSFRHGARNGPRPGGRDTPSPLEQLAVDQVVAFGEYLCGITTKDRAVLTSCARNAALPLEYRAHAQNVRDVPSNYSHEEERWFGKLFSRMRSTYQLVAAMASGDIVALARLVWEPSLPWQFQAEARMMATSEDVPTSRWQTPIGSLWSHLPFNPESWSPPTAVLAAPEVGAVPGIHP